MKERCDNCKYFKRGKWLPEHGGGEQLGGTCKILCQVLKLTNSDLIWKDTIHVQGSFGCSLYRNCEDDKKTDLTVMKSIDSIPVYIDMFDHTGR